MIPVNAVTFAYGVLAIIGLVIVIWFAFMGVAQRFSDAVADSLDRTREWLAPYALWAAFVVALLAMVGSLYFSEIAHFEPCRLCWFQRIFMYPLVVILGIGAWRKDVGVRRYAIPLAVIGGIIATYHYFLEWFPEIDIHACTEGIPCTAVWFRELGFISIPFLALTAFLLVITFLAIPFGADEDASTSGQAA